MDQCTLEKCQKTLGTYKQALVKVCVAHCQDDQSKESKTYNAVCDTCNDTQLIADVMTQVVEQALSSNDRVVLATAFWVIQRHLNEASDCENVSNISNAYCNTNIVEQLAKVFEHLEASKVSINALHCAINLTFLNKEWEDKLAANQLPKLLAFLQVLAKSSILLDDNDNNNDDDNDEHMLLECVCQAIYNMRSSSHEHATLIQAALPSILSLTRSKALRKASATQTLADLSFISHKASQFTSPNFQDEEVECSQTWLCVLEDALQDVQAYKSCISNNSPQAVLQLFKGLCKSFSLQAQDPHMVLSKLVQVLQCLDVTSPSDQPTIKSGFTAVLVAKHALLAVSACVERIERIEQQQHEQQHQLHQQATMQKTDLHSTYDLLSVVLDALSTFKARTEASEQPESATPSQRIALHALLGNVDRALAAVADARTRFAHSLVNQLQEQALTFQKQTQVLQTALTDARQQNQSFVSKLGHILEHW